MRSFLAIPVLLIAAGGEKVEMPSNLVNVTISASSTRAGKPLDTYAAWRVLDGNADTLWCEGKADAGTDETITITFPDGAVVDEVTLVTGIQTTPELFEQNNVPTSIEISTDDGRTVLGSDGSMLSESDYTGTMSIELGGPKIHKLTLKLGEIGKTTVANHTCIGDLRMRSGTDDIEPLISLDQAAVAALPAALEGLVQAFAKCDQAKLADRAQFPLAFDFLQTVAPSPENGFTQGTKPVRVSYRASTDLAARCRAKDAAAPSVGETEIDGLVYTARSAGPATLTFRVDTREGEPDTWRLAWKDRRWKLVGISRIPE